MCPSSGLWGGPWIVIPSLPSWVHHRSTGVKFDALQACVLVSISSYVHIVSNVLPRSLCSWPRTSLHLLEEGHSHPVVRFTYLCHLICEELVFFSFLYVKLFELGVEIALNHRSAVTHHTGNLDVDFSFARSPRCASTSTKNVTAPAVLLFLCSSIASRENFASGAPTNVVFLPSPTPFFTAFSSPWLSHK